MENEERLSSLENRLTEVEKKAKSQSNKAYIPLVSAIGVAVIGGLFSLMSLIYQRRSELQQKRREFELHTVQMAVEKVQRSQARKNLEFLIQSGFIKGEKLDSLIEKEDGIPFFNPVAQVFDSLKFESPLDSATLPLGTTILRGNFRGSISEDQPYSLWILDKCEGKITYAPHPTYFSTSGKWQSEIMLDKEGRHTLMAVLVDEAQLPKMKELIDSGTYKFLEHPPQGVWLVDFIGVQVVAE